jgi:phosphatidylserine/phosphatidylglycerophosphate/cardiolipin synthase-like enzyme
MASGDSVMYSGDSSYKYVDKLIKEPSGELLIVSPYISNYYLKMLVRYARNKHIRVITSGSSLGYGSMLKNFVVHSIKGYIKAIIFSMILDIISIYLDFTYTTAIITLILVLLGAFAYLRYRKTGSNMQVKVVRDRFIHEKLYIGDGMAISGSANLTYNGMHRNIEHIEITSDADKIAQLRAHFGSLWQNG